MGLKGRFLTAGLFAVASILASAQTIVNDASLADESEATNWLAYGRTYREQRYSPLSAIDTKTVERLGVDWVLELPQDRSLIGTPLVVDGILYFTGSYSVTRAVEAKTGKLLWEYDPKSIEHAGDRLRIMVDSSRGLAFWNGKVIIATIDGRLVAIDAKTGKLVWETMTVDPRKALYITGTLKVFRGKVIIGNGGTEQHAARGYVTAYDAETGELVWRFYVVPGNPADGFESLAMAMAAKTWTGEWWKFGGGGNVWNGITYDPDFNTVLVGTGNGSPWNRKIRSPGGGDNLFLCAIVALDADTGEYKWHYQTVPGETWDYNSSMDIVLAPLKYGGQTIKALLHAPKNGFFYVINRANGELLSAEKIARATWASHIDLKTGRPVEIPGARYEDGDEIVWPGPFGAHNWHAMSYNPDTGLAYIPTMEMPARFTETGIDLEVWESPNFDASTGVNWEDAGETGAALLQAWDPIRQKAVWKVPLPNNWNPGTLTTACKLVFQGRADGEFVAYHAETGERLWSVNVGSGISAPPITYAIDGRQYISLLVGWGGYGLFAGPVAAQHGWGFRQHPRRLLTFALDATLPMPSSPPPFFARALDVPEFEVDEKLAKHGLGVYGQTCFLCHGGGAISGGYAPDLRASPLTLSREAFVDVVKNGARQSAGLPRFTYFTDRDIDGLLHYVRQQARKAVAP